MGPRQELCGHMWDPQEMNSIFMNLGCPVGSPQHVVSGLGSKEGFLIASCIALLRSACDEFARRDRVLSVRVSEVGTLKWTGSGSKWLGSL